MSFPVIFHIGKASLHAHLVFEVLAYSLGYRFYAYLRSKTHDPISESDRMWIFIGAAFGGFFGGHLLGVFERPDDWAKGVNWFYFMGNKTILGGLLGGLLGVELIKKRIGVTTSSGDLMTFPLIFAMIIGRVGCHLEGLEDGTFGNPTIFFAGMDFGDNQWRHPVNLYEITFLVLLGLSINFLNKKGPLSIFRVLYFGFRKETTEIPNPKPEMLSNGSAFRLFMVGYLCWRFVLEYLKPAYFWWFGLSSIQIAALLGLVYYRNVFLKPKSLFLSTN